MRGRGRCEPENELRKHEGGKESAKGEGAKERMCERKHKELNVSEATYERQERSLKEEAGANDRNSNVERVASS